MTVAGVTGHQNLPTSATTLVQLALPDILNELSVTALWTSLAEGADQLCAGIALEAGVDVGVVVPSRSYESTFEAPALNRYRSLLRQASDVVTLDFAAPTETAFFEAGKRVAVQCDVLIAVWDGKGAAGLGGTGDVVEYARGLGRAVRIIWPHGVSR